MSKNDLAPGSKAQLIQRILGRKTGQAASDGRMAEQSATRQAAASHIPESFTRFDRHPGYEKMLVPKAMADRMGVRNPFFRSHDGVAAAHTRIDGRDYLNFANYNYLGLSAHPEVNAAAKAAMDQYGTSASASRLVAGERRVQRELEEELAQNYEVDDCVVFVSGHATNVSTIGYLFGPKDLVIHDSLIHNSILQGIQLSGAARRSFPHNDSAALERILADIRGQFERVLIVIEGLYSMDGDIPNLLAFIDIKRRYKAFLMVDEAHALGVLGKTGRGSHEHFGVAGRDVDIWMGTLSKTLASCGGYIAGDRALVELLKYAASGFVYSVGISPVLAAASLKALQIMRREPERVHTLQERGSQFLNSMRSMGINTGFAEGYAVIPAITGSSLKAVKLSGQLFDAGLNVQPIIHPAVEEKAARLRFFLSSTHSQDDIDLACETVHTLMKK